MVLFRTSYFWIEERNVFTVATNMKPSLPMPGYFLVMLFFARLRQSKKRAMYVCELAHLSFVAQKRWLILKNYAKRHKVYGRCFRKKKLCKVIKLRYHMNYSRASYIWWAGRRSSFTCSWIRPSVKSAYFYI